MGRYAVYKHNTCERCQTKDVTTFGIGGPDDGEYGPYDGSDVMSECEKCLSGQIRLIHVMNGHLPDPVVDKAKAFLAETINDVKQLKVAKSIITDLLSVVETERQIRLGEREDV